ncbi:DUF6602 domain-containing protein [Peribacillus simplex]|uniref:DUF6602 domain-containing protein n=1 Tax=Peribacillus simplex TaxID=1478 RepID=UPI003D29325F
MLNNKEKYHESIALELKSKVDRLSYFLPFENGTIYHKLQLGLEEELPINEIKNILKKLFVTEAFKQTNGALWNIFECEILQQDVREFLRDNNQNYDGNTINYANKKKALEIFFGNLSLDEWILDLEKIKYLGSLIKDVTPRNSQNYPEGNYREYLLIEYLRKILPSTVEVGSGFVIDENFYTTNQIDIIIYDANIAPLFKSGDLVVVIPASVYGIVEVKTTHYPSNLEKELQNASQNYELIKKSLENEFYDDKFEVFNGIFYFKSNLTLRNIEDGLKTVKILKDLENVDYNVNHIAFGDSIFVRYNNNEYSFYNMDKGKLAFAYFFSNLIDIIMTRKDLLNDALSKFIFPIEREGGKESRKIHITNNMG